MTIKLSNFTCKPDAVTIGSSTMSASLNLVMDPSESCQLESICPSKECISFNERQMSVVKKVNNRCNHVLTSNPFSARETSMNQEYRIKLLKMSEKRELKMSPRICQIYIKSRINFNSMLPITAVLVILVSLFLGSSTLTFADEETLVRIRSAKPTNSHHSPIEMIPSQRRTSSDRSKRGLEGTNNGLGKFLDDMDHKELSSIAAGRPIDDIFRSKSSPSDIIGELQLASDFSGHQNGDINSKLPMEGLTTNGTRPVNQTAHLQQRRHTDESLIVGQSRQQIYSECALILQRTYVRNIDDPKHHLVPSGKTEQACISYKDIDRAVEQAKHKLKFRDISKQRKKISLANVAAGKPPIAPLEIIHSTLEPPEDLIAAIGELNMATTQIIADQFDLSNDELLNGLPLIDMSKSKFWQMCPLLVRQDIKCKLTRFRTFTGHCNNLKHPTWGAAMTPFARYLPPVHPDGIWIPRKSIITEITFDIGSPNFDVDSSVHSDSAPSVKFPIFTDDESPITSAYHHSNNVVFGERNQNNRFERNNIRHLNNIGNDDELSRSASARSISSSIIPKAGAQVHSIANQGQYRSQRQARSNSFRFEDAFGDDINLSGSRDRRLNSVNQLLPQESAITSLANRQRKRSLPVDLPSARLVTSVVHKDYDLPNHDFTILFMSWGQMLDHDLTRGAQPPSSIKCCNQDGEPKHKLCLPIEVPENDPFYSKFNVKCLEFRRSLAGLRPNCVLGPRVHQNAITSPIDANFVYGSSQAQAEALRLFKGGRLRDRDWFKQEGLKPLLPAQEIEPDLECIARPKDLFCFLAGDVRANEQTHLTVIHTLYMREHNRIADRLADLNPHWEDERIFQETRHIVAAGVQHVMINEYTPLLIGKKMAELYNLTAQSHDSGHFNHGSIPDARYAYWHGYDPTVTTSVSNSFAAGAFRQGHTFVQGQIKRYNKMHEFVASEKLRHLFKQPFLLYQPGVLDELTGGMINQPSQSYDPFISEDISGHLFQPPESQFGHDLAAINLQRGRDQGLPGYNLFREWCGLPRAETFEQLEPYLTNRTAYQYSRLYKHVDDIDLWSGGISERKLPGAAIGPTFACIIARQFSNTRRGDRFWYENPGLPSSFTPEQLGEIRKVTLAKILCANSDDLPTIQRWALRMPHPVMNPRILCNELPEIDLSFWQEE